MRTFHNALPSLSSSLSHISSSPLGIKDLETNSKCCCTKFMTKSTQNYLLRWCRVSFWLLSVSCGAQSSCRMASCWWQPWSLPQHCGRDASWLLRPCMEWCWCTPHQRLTSSWSPGDLSWSHSPHRPARSGQASPLRDGLEGPEKPTQYPPPLLRQEKVIKIKKS